MHRSPASRHRRSERVPTTRRLLRRLRDIMAGSGAAQERLDQIVRVVAAEMVAEVCSAYVMRAGEVLELFATEGLRPEAVHRTRLRVGEGLVGRHRRQPRARWRWPTRSRIPNFAYRPETGEEIYHSLMGVPILRGGRVLGVLVVQNRTLRHYTEDEIEILQTIAMIVAELVASGELVNPHEMAQSRGGGAAADAARRASASIRAWRSGRRCCTSPASSSARSSPRTSMPSIERLRERCRGDAAGDRRAGRRRAASSAPASIATSSRPIACSPTDRGWLARIAEAMRSGLTAEAAVQKVARRHAQPA